MSLDTSTRNHHAVNWQDAANLLLGIWLFLSPWILNFGGSEATGPAGNASWNAWVLGALVFIAAATALGRMDFWQERLNVLLGAWIFVAPWLLGFSGAEYANAAWNHWIVGALIFLIAISALFLSEQSDARRAHFGGR